MTATDGLDRAARLRERADTERPDAWVPEHPGDELVGELVRYERGTTSYGDQVIAIVQPTDAAARSLWLLTAILRDEFAKHRPAPGEWVLVRYLGKREPKGDGPAYQAYTVVVDREPVQPDWAAIGAEAEAEIEAQVGARGAAA
ncbi:MAG TPA: hypothetical protein VD790_11360 [Thermoleophilaceae bacterium]|nr:hypothetical protein [Thermoleophilaceae bacterium]